MIIKVKVKPNSKEQKLIRISDTEYKIYLKAPARDNKANVELLKLLKKSLKKPVAIKSGLSSRNKIIEVLE